MRISFRPFGYVQGQIARIMGDFTDWVPYTMHMHPMKQILKEIQTGQFTREWVREYKGGLKKYNALLKAGEKHKIEKTGAYLRSMMPWMTKKNIKGVQAAYA